MISLELASRLYPCNKERVVAEVKLYEDSYDDKLIVSYELFNKNGDHIGWGSSGGSIYKVANDCKQWASSLGFGLSSWVEQGEDGACELVYKYQNIKMFFSADTEAKAIFKACEWILYSKATK